VVPLRAAISRERAGDLRPSRERLGRWIGLVKAEAPAPPPEGVVRRFGD
jgi:hypothetical protein